MEKVKTTSKDLKGENVEKLRQIFPNVFDEGKLDIEKLKNFLGDNTIDENVIEKYSLNWAGKSNAFKAIRVPSTGTLVRDNKGVDEDNSENIFIEGDNLEVLKLLQKHYYNKIKMIYIDPPYNTGKDFVYKDNWTQDIESYYKLTAQTDENGIKMIVNTEKNGRFHSDWLTMMYPRLFLARNLLKDDGVIFISIDDNEVANLRLIMDEIFGEENFIANFVWNSSTGGGIRGKFLNQSHQYILVYSKNKLNTDMFFAPLSQAAKDQYNKEDEIGIYREKDFAWKNSSWGTNQKYFIGAPDGQKIKPKNGYLFRFIEKTFEEYLNKNMVVFKKTNNGPLIKEDGTQADWNIYIKKYLGDGTGAPSSVIPKEIVGINNEGTTELNSLFEGNNYFESPKNVRLLKYLFSLPKKEDNDIILDFFAGSGTTAHAVMDLNAEDGGNRKWICVQLPEITDEKSEAYKAGYKTISEISRERIKRAGKNIKEENKDKKDLDLGFKTFTLEKSNYRMWNILGSEDTKEDILDQAKLFTEKPLIDSYKEIDVVNEILLKEGFDLNSTVEEKGGVYIISEKAEDEERRMFISFAKNVSEKDIEKLKLKNNDTFVCFDSALTDTIKVNIVRGINLNVM